MSKTANSTFLAKVAVKLKPSVLDPQGMAVKGALETLGFEGLKQVRVGKLIELHIEGSPQSVKEPLEEMCKKLLANPVIEDYAIEIVEAKQ